jgi:flagellar motor switch protein FliG
VLRVATIDGVQPIALRELNESMTKLLAGSDQMTLKAMGGVRTAAEILNMLPGSVENEAVESVREVDPELAQAILDEMFKFEDLIELDDRAVQMVLREVQSEALVVALKGADQGLRDKIFKNMSQRAAEQLRDDLESKGPVKLSEVELQQKDIIKIVRRLSEEGQIAMGGKGDDAFV